MEEVERMPRLMRIINADLRFPIFSVGNNSFSNAGRNEKAGVV